MAKDTRKIAHGNFKVRYDEIKKMPEGPDKDDAYNALSAEEDAYLDSLDDFLNQEGGKDWENADDEDLNYAIKYGKYKPSEYSKMLADKQKPKKTEITDKDIGLRYKFGEDPYSKPKDLETLAAEWNVTPDEAAGLIKKLYKEQGKKITADANADAEIKTYAQRQYASAAFNNDKDTMSKLEQAYPDLKDSFDAIKDEHSGLQYWLNRVGEYVAPMAYETENRHLATGNDGDTWFKDPITGDGTTELERSAFVDGALLPAYLLGGGKLIGPAKHLLGQLKGWAGKNFFAGGVPKAINAVSNLVAEYPKVGAYTDKAVNVAGGALEQGVYGAGGELANSATTDSDFNWARPIGGAVSNFTVPFFGDMMFSKLGSLFGKNPAMSRGFQAVGRGLRSGDRDFNSSDAVIDIATQTGNYNNIVSKPEAEKLQTAFDKEWNSKKASLDAKHVNELQQIESMPNGRDKNHARNNFKEKAQWENDVFEQQREEAQGKLNQTKLNMGSARQVAQTKKDLDAFENDYGGRIEGVRNADGTVTPSFDVFITPKNSIDGIKSLVAQKKRNLTPDEFSEWLLAHPKAAALVDDPEPISLTGGKSSEAVGKAIGALTGGVSDVIQRSKATTKGDIGWMIPILDTRWFKSSTDAEAIQGMQDKQRKKQKERKLWNSDWFQVPEEWELTTWTK